MLIFTSRCMVYRLINSILVRFFDNSFYTIEGDGTVYILITGPLCLRLNLRSLRDPKTWLILLYPSRPGPWGGEEKEGGRGKEWHGPHTCDVGYTGSRRVRSRVPTCVTTLLLGSLLGCVRDLRSNHTSHSLRSEDEWESYLFREEVTLILYSVYIKVII